MLAAVQNTNSLSISNTKENLLKDQTRLACKWADDEKYSGLVKLEMDITWHDNIAGCYNQMSTFQEKMLTFQSDKMCDDQKCQDLRHCLHAAARFFQTFHTKQTFNISTDLFHSSRSDSLVPAPQLDGDHLRLGDDQLLPPPHISLLVGSFFRIPTFHGLLGAAPS